MRLRTMAGAYVGQIRDYSASAGLAALRTGTAVALEAPPTATGHRPVAASTVPSDSDRSTRSARQRAGRK